MSEQTTTTEATEATASATPADVATVVAKGLTTPQEPEQQSQGDPGEDALGDAGKRALQAEREARENAERESRTNQERAEQAEQAKQEALDSIPKAVADHLREHLVTLHSISDEDRDLFLTSDDPATLLKQVSRLSQQTVVAPTTPKPDATQGGAGSPPALNSDQLENALKAKLGIA